MYDRDKLIDRILELDGKVSKQSERIKALQNGLAMVSKALNDGLELEKGDPIHKKIDELLTQ